jgi:hypothetical protein
MWLDASGLALIQKYVSEVFDLSLLRRLIESRFHVT